MCGINGIFRYDKKSLDYRKLEIMNNLLMHRGPDGNGIKLFDHIGLAHTRLSIIDLNIRGKQPMVSHNKNSWIVYNGEIYNYLELRSQLIDLGYQFKTKTDTEVILHAYDCWGNKAFSKFNGMFALSIYDSSSRKLICARDRFGIKPLYYFQDSNKFIFSSEIKPILSVLDKTPEIDKQVLFNYLYYGRVNYSNATFFGGILNLSPGHYIEITSSGCSKEEKWWNFTHSQRPSSIKILRKLFEDSVKLRMRSDVPVGACLSGGIDSTSIVNTALKFTNKDFSTYSAITDDNWPNSENKYIHLVNKKNRLSSNYIKPNGPNLIKNLKKIVKIQEEPFTTPAIYSQWEVMKLANKKGSKVLLDGQGADEILGGYHYFYSYFLFELYKKHKYFELIFEMIQIYIKIKNLRFLKVFFFLILPDKIKSFHFNNESKYSDETYFNNKKNKNNVLEKLVKAESISEIFVNHINYKLQHLLRYEDKNSMAFSVESRVPFLDYRLVRYCIERSSRFHINRGYTKFAFRLAMKDIVEDKIRYRKDKIGFKTMEDEWIQSKEFKNYILKELTSNSFKKRGYLNHTKFNIFLNKYINGEKVNFKFLWRVFNLELWNHEFIDNKAETN